jgi:hypothetical protein
MRPGQNKRMRGRNTNNNRKGPNPLTRSYESNGPDVKIRGTAQHVAEKYLQLARDAQSSGDPVMAENYLQHAEHYFRIIAAAQQAQQQQMGFRQQNDTQPSQEEPVYDDFDVNDRFASPAERAQAILNQPQPNVGHQGNPFGGQRDASDEAAQPDRQDRSERQDRGERQDPGDRQDRGDRRDRAGGRNNPRQRNFDNGESGGQRQPDSDRQPQAKPAPARDTDDQDDGQPMLPSFITRANRVPEVEAEAGTEDAAAEGAARENRPRRRRRPMPRSDRSDDGSDERQAKPDELAAGE